MCRLRTTFDSALSRLVFSSADALICTGCSELCGYSALRGRSGFRVTGRTPIQ